MSSEGPRESKPKVPSAVSGENAPAEKDLFRRNEIAAYVSGLAGKANEYWSPDYFEVLGPDGSPLIDEAGKRIIVELGEMKVSGFATTLVKLQLPESARRGGHKKESLETSIIKPLSSLEALLPDRAIAAVRRVPELRMEEREVTPGNSYLTKRIERVQPRDLEKAQNKIISFMLAREIPARVIEQVLASGSFGPRLNKSELERILPTSRQTDKFIADHSYVDLPGFVMQAVSDASRRIRVREEEDRRAAILTEKAAAAAARAGEGSEEESKPEQPKEMTASMYARSEQYLRDLTGFSDDERWSDAKEALAELRKEMDRLQWFSFGENTAAPERRGRYTQLVLAPRDLEHERTLTNLLERINIQPWPEQNDNVMTLVIEYRRDIELLRAAMVIDYLEKIESRKEGEELLKEAQKRMRKVESWLAEKRVEEKEAHTPETQQREAEFAKLEEEQARLLRMNLEAEDFRNKRKAEKARIIGEFFAAIPEPTEEEFARPLKIPQDHYYRFGYPDVAKAPPRGTRKERAPIVPERLDPQELDGEWEAYEDAFFEGRINETTLEQQIGVTETPAATSNMPNLILFPKKYEWIKGERGKSGMLRERATGRLFNDSDVLDEVLEARTGSPELYEKSIRELALMNRTLILWKLRQVKDRHSSADPDDLFQAGIRGLAYAVDHYDMRPDTKFNSYLIPCIEGHMRRVANSTRFRAVQAPVHMSGERKKVIETKRTLQGASPNEAVRMQQVGQALAEEGVVVSGGNPDRFDSYLRKILYSYQDAELSAFEDEELTPDNVDMLGRALFEDPLTDDPAEAAQARERLDAMLQTLTPREERAMRIYFELEPSNGQVSRDIYEALSKQLESEGVSLPLEEAKRKIRDLTAYGDLNKPETLEKLSSSDRMIALRYADLLAERVGKVTLEDVGVQMSVSHTRVQQILNKAIRKLRHPARAKFLPQP